MARHDGIHFFLLFVVFLPVSVSLSFSRSLALSWVANKTIFSIQKCTTKERMLKNESAWNNEAHNFYFVENHIKRNSRIGFFIFLIVYVLVYAGFYGVAWNIKSTTHIQTFIDSNMHESLDTGEKLRFRSLMKETQRKKTITTTIITTATTSSSEYFDL